MVEFGVTKRGGKTLIFNNYEYWMKKTNKEGHVLWRCIKYETFKCPATLKTDGETLIGNKEPEHTHSGNAATAFARKAVSTMKQHMTETLATPTASQGAVVVNLNGYVQMALPKRATLSRVLRRHRQIKNMLSKGVSALPPTSFFMILVPMMTG